MIQSTKPKLFLLVSLLLILSGCVRTEIVDELSLIGGIGFDTTDDGKEIRGTVVFPVYLPDQPTKNATITTEGEIKKMILQQLNRYSSDSVETGSIEIVLFGKELAQKEGILQLIDAFQRDPAVGAGLFLAVVDGEAQKLLEGNYGVRGNTRNIFKLIEQNMKNEDVPKTNLQRFLSDYYQKGKSPYMPQLKQISKDKLKINGIQLFKYGKTVDFIPENKMFFFKLLVDKYSEGLHSAKFEEGEASIRSIRSSRSLKLEKRDPYKIHIHIKVTGIVDEFTGNKLSHKLLHKLERHFEKDINRECQTMIEEFQEKRIDPVGIGHFVKTKERNFDMNKWNDSQYENATVKVTSEVKITETGVIE